MSKKLPFETQWCSGTDQEEIRWRWYQALERLGPDNVRARLAQQDAGSGSSLRRLGREVITKGFAEDWLAYRDQKRGSADAWKWTALFVVATLGAVGSAVAAWPVVAGWFK